MFNDKSKTIVERVSKQDEKINEIVEVLNNHMENHPAGDNPPVSEENNCPENIALLNEYTNEYISVEFPSLENDLNNLKPIVSVNKSDIKTLKDENISIKTDIQTLKNEDSVIKSDIVTLEGNCNQIVNNTLPVIEGRIDNLSITQDDILQRLENINTSGGNAPSITVNGDGRFVNVEEFGAVGDGIADDTQAFQEALNSGLNITATRGNSYLLRKSLSIKTNGQIIDLDNATVLLDHASDYTSGGDIESLFMVSNDAFTALSLREIHLSQGYLNITNASSNLAVGDFLRIVGHQGSYTHNGNELKEVIQIMVQVIAIEDSKVWVDYSTPVGGFNFDTTSPSSLFSSISCAKVTKVIKNVQIRNMFIRDITEYSTTDSKALSGITGKFVHRMIVENVTFENMLLNGLTFNFGHDCMCNNISARLARRSTGGKGYLLRLMACNKIQASNLYGYQVRHVFDITGGAYYEIRNAYGYNTQAGAFSLHGNCEHDIYLYNLGGVDNKNDSQILGFGSGAVSGTGFPNAVDNVNIYSSNVKVYTEGYSMFGRVIFNDSHVKMYVTLPRVIFNNCYLSARLPLYPRNSKRGRNIELYQIFNNCNINVSDANTGFDFIQATNCRIIALNVGCTNALISNSVIKRLTVNSTTISANTTSDTNIVQGNLFK